MIEIAATFGDPTGIGPEVGSKALRKFLKQNTRCCVHLFAPSSSLSFRHPRMKVIDPENSLQEFVPGRPSKSSGARALRDLDRAIDFCLESKSRALVTGPVDKFWCAKTDPQFTGHTEFLQKRSKAKGTTMLLAGPVLRVALVTTHLPLKDVAKRLSTKKIIETTTRLEAFLSRRFKQPRLAVLGLNPHASDQGLFGDEEARLIEPALRTLKRRGMNVYGPFSADSFFHRASDFDGVIAMYHDQGLIPLKLVHFYDAVNITLGLPFLRVSVDHGTAFDIAGKKKASSLSYESALNTAYAHLKKIRPH